MTKEGMEHLRLYLAGDEGLSVTLIEFPITEYCRQIASVLQEQIDEKTHETTFKASEDIALEKLKIQGEVVFAGYGQETKTLIIGKMTKNPHSPALSGGDQG